jgi:hypothetical protein
VTPRSEVLLYLLGAFATVGLLFFTTFNGFTFLIVLILLLTVLAARGIGRLAADVPWAIPALLGLGAALAIVSVATGFLNGLSDEPYGTPAYASLGWGLYTHPVAFSYVQYGTTYFANSYDVYLPLLAFVQIPGIDYRWVSVLAWAGMIYLVRDRPIALTGLAVPWIPLLAANGQNDFVPLFALTLALAVPLGRYRWPAEVFALALKQLANIVVVLYHLARREYLRAALAVLITLAILAPFLYLDANGVYCHVLLGDPGTGCTGHPWTFFVFKRNYWLYPTWILVVFYAPLRRFVLGGLHRLAPSRWAEPGLSTGATPSAGPRSYPPTGQVVGLAAAPWSPDSVLRSESARSPRRDST